MKQSSTLERTRGDTVSRRAIGSIFLYLRDQFDDTLLYCVLAASTIATDLVPVAIPLQRFRHRKRFYPHDFHSDSLYMRVLTRWLPSSVVSYHGWSWLVRRISVTGARSSSHVPPKKYEIQQSSRKCNQGLQKHTNAYIQQQTNAGCIRYNSCIRYHSPFENSTTTPVCYLFSPQKNVIFFHTVT